MDGWVEGLFRLWQQGADDADLEDGFAAFYTDPVVVNGVEMARRDLVGRARSLHAAFEGLRAQVVQVVQGADDALALAFVMRGRHTGPYEGPLGIIQPTGTEVEIPTIDVLTLTGGKISAIWVRADDLGLLRQLGALDRLVIT
jgi:predicted ester cyclase